MPRHDPHSYTDLSQGRIQHISFELEADFDQRQLRGTADYRLDRPVAGAFDLDTRDLDVRSVVAGGRPIRFSFEDPDPILGSRLRLIDLAGADAFTLSFVTST